MQVEERQRQTEEKKTRKQKLLEDHQPSQDPVIDLNLVEKCRGRGFTGSDLGVCPKMSSVMYPDLKYLLGVNELEIIPGKQLTKQLISVGDNFWLE